MTAGQTCQDEKQGVNNPDEALADWYDEWVGKEPERFYAYIKRSSDGAWIGDVNFKINQNIVFDYLFISSHKPV